MDMQPDSVTKDSGDGRSALETHFPRIAGDLVNVWKNVQETDKFLNKMLVDDRYGREGFPEAVFADLMFLSDLNWKRTHLDQNGVEIVPDGFSFGRPF